MRCKEVLYDLGVAEVLTPVGNTLRVYGVERTFCDILRTHSQVDIQVVTEAFKRYATDIAFEDACDVVVELMDD